MPAPSSAIKQKGKGDIAPRAPCLMPLARYTTRGQPIKMQRYTQGRVLFTITLRGVTPDCLTLRISDVMRQRASATAGATAACE